MCGDGGGGWGGGSGGRVCVCVCVCVWVVVNLPEGAVILKPNVCPHTTLHTLVKTSIIIQRQYMMTSYLERLQIIVKTFGT